MSESNNNNSLDSNSEHSRATTTPLIEELSDLKISSMCSKKRDWLLIEDDVEQRMEEEHDTELSTTTNITTIFNLKDREHLNLNTQLKAGCDMYWKTFGSIRCGATSIRTEEHLDLFLKIFKALLHPESFSIKAATDSINRHYQHKNGTILTKEEFQKFLLKIIDAWMAQLQHTQQHWKFFTTLFERITTKTYHQSRSAWITSYASLNSIKSLYEDIDEKGTARRTSAFKSLSVLAKTEATPAIVTCLARNVKLMKQKSDVSDIIAAARNEVDLPPRRISHEQHKTVVTSARATAEQEWEAIIAKASCRPSFEKSTTDGDDDDSVEIILKKKNHQVRKTNSIWKVRRAFGLK